VNSKRMAVAGLLIAAIAIASIAYATRLSPSHTSTSSASSSKTSYSTESSQSSSSTASSAYPNDTQAVAARIEQLGVDIGSLSKTPIPGIDQPDPSTLRAILGFYSNSSVVVWHGRAFFFDQAPLTNNLTYAYQVIGRDINYSQVFISSPSIAVVVPGAIGASYDMVLVGSELGIGMETLGSGAFSFTIQVQQQWVEEGGSWVIQSEQENWLTFLVQNTMSTLAVGPAIGSQTCPSSDCEAVSADVERLVSDISNLNITVEAEAGTSALSVTAIKSFYSRSFIGNWYGDYSNGFAGRIDNLTDYYRVLGSFYYNQAHVQNLTTTEPGPGVVNASFDIVMLGAELDQYGTYVQPESPANLTIHAQEIWVGKGETWQIQSESWNWLNASLAASVVTTLVSEWAQSVSQRDIPNIVGFYTNSSVLHVYGNITGGLSYPEPWAGIGGNYSGTSNIDLFYAATIGFYVASPIATISNLTVSDQGGDVVNTTFQLLVNGTSSLVGPAQATIDVLQVWVKQGTGAWHIENEYWQMITSKDGAPAH
jgi:ketosteroid isomerase-like protein